MATLIRVKQVQNIEELTLDGWRIIQNVGVGNLHSIVDSDIETMMLEYMEGADVVSANIDDNYGVLVEAEVVVMLGFIPVPKRKVFQNTYRFWTVDADFVADEYPVGCLADAILLGQ